MLRQTLEGQLEALRMRACNSWPLVFDPPATEAQAESVELQLGISLPPSFRHALLNVSARVEFRWFVPEEQSFPPPFGEIFSGGLHWSLADLVDLNQAKDATVQAVFPNPQDPYDAVWHNKLAFYDVGNGDYIAIDLGSEQVVYLSHGDGQGHGFVLAENFQQLLARWVPLACPGGEDWQWLPFTAGKACCLDPEGANGKAWRTLIGLD